MGSDYIALRVIGVGYKILGVITGIATLLAMLGLGSMFGGVRGGLLGTLLVLIYGGGIALTLYAAGEGVSLLIALEENTRTTAWALQQQTNARRE